MNVVHYKRLAGWHGSGLRDSAARGGEEPPSRHRLPPARRRGATQPLHAEPAVREQQFVRANPSSKQFFYLFRSCLLDPRQEVKVYILSPCVFLLLLILRESCYIVVNCTSILKTSYTGTSVLRIRDVYPGSDFFSIPDPHQRI